MWYERVFEGTDLTEGEDSTYIDHLAHMARILQCQMLRTMKAFATVCCLALACTLVQADVYMHYIRGGNNRLNEGGQGRNNGDRLWDSQNNNRGGYNAGSVLRNYFYEDTSIPIEWTQQHSCGDVTGNNCEIILQYTCGDKFIRDGTTTDTIPLNNDDGDCDDADGNCDGMLQYGRHESLASYQNCRYRSRNQGLFTANQNLQGPSARFTRQNNNGGRSGLECPEERDYYPYWAPTAWKDIAIITNRPSRCAAFQAESQNVKARWYCEYDANNAQIVEAIQNNVEGWLPITKAECEDPVKFPTGKWTRVEPFNIPAPDCVQAAYTRDNHLGNAVDQGTDDSVQTNGFPNYYNWTIRQLKRGKRSLTSSLIVTTADTSAFASLNRRHSRRLLRELCFPSSLQHFDRRVSLSGIYG